MKNFTYNIPTKVFFGRNSLDKAVPEIVKYSKNILIVYGSDRIKNSGLLKKLTDDLDRYDVRYKTYSGIKANPTLKSVHEGINVIKENDLDFVLAFGGGSVIDAAKGMAAGAAMDTDPWLFCKKEKIVKKAFPLAAVLTLSATGSEMNGGSVISNEDTGEKLPFGSDLTRPVFSVLDPTLTFTVPKDQTAYGIADIYIHVTEQYFTKFDSAAVADRISEALMKVCIQYGRTAIDEPENYEARSNLMWAGSLALNSLIGCGKSGGDWATHVIEHELSAAYDIAHGLGLAIILPRWMEYVFDENEPDRFAMYAENVFGIIKDDKVGQAKAGIKATEDFFRSLDIPMSLREIGIDESRIVAMAEQAVQFGNLGSYKVLDKDDVVNILKMCL